MHDDRERFLASGFDDYLAKPVDVLELLDTVHRHRGARDG
jgi:CheY-like chemotaxis protein